MMRLSKKGVDKTLLVSRSSVTIKEVEELGQTVCLRFDDYELAMTPDKARGMAMVVLSKLRELEKRALLENQCTLLLEEGVL